MFHYNNKTYAKNDKEMVNSLFSPVNGQTCNGYYKKRKNGVLLLGLDKKPFAFIVNNPKQGQFVVNAFEHNGKAHYMHSTSTLVEKYLGYPDGLSMAGERSLIEQSFFTE